ncbi:MAG: hypothetical protein KAV48_06135, partial [Methanomicrobia archaeon]|nr:hypothetical protein [Methanomicrobia archaeon]
FPLYNIVEALISYIKRSYTKNKTDAIEYLFERLDLTSKEFETIGDEKTYDDLIYILKELSPHLKIDGKHLFIKYDISLIGLAAALGYVRQERDIVHVKKRKRDLIVLAKNNELDLNEFLEYYMKITTGIGVRRRKLVYEAFKTFFLNEEGKLNWEEAFSYVK